MSNAILKPGLFFDVEIQVQNNSIKLLHIPTPRRNSPQSKLTVHQLVQRMIQGVIKGKAVEVPLEVKARSAFIYFGVSLLIPLSRLPTP